MRGALKSFQWPLFVTLTMENSESPESVRELRRAFGRFRNRRLWKESVKGGVAAIEVTNKGNGWHPHLHALVDCEWLSVHCPPPHPRESEADKKRKFEYARRELSATWADVLGQETAVVLATRAHGEQTVKEVLKYSIKGSELIEVKGEIAPMLRILEMTRLITTFGSLYGKTKELDALDDSKPPACEECKSTGTMLPEQVIQYLIRS